jgi:ferredoxin
MVSGLLPCLFSLIQHIYSLKIFQIMSVKKVWIEDGCTACGLCVDICPEVFDLPDDVAVIKEGANFDEHEDDIKEAAGSCPVEVIHFEE